MRSIQKNNDLLCQSQLEWRYTKDHKWSNEGKGSGLHRKQAVPENLGGVQPRGGMLKKKASWRVFHALEDEWAIRCPDFNRLRNVYRTYVRKCKRNKKHFLKFGEWQQRQELPQEQQR